MKNFPFSKILFTQPLIHRIAISIYFFCCGCTFATWAARIPAIKDQFHLNEAELGAVLFMLPLGSLVALPIAGWAVASFGSRYITFISAIMYLVFLMLIGYSNSVFMLSAVLFCFGFAGDILNIAMNTQALLVQEEMYAKPLMSSFHGMWSLGAMTGALMGGILMTAGLSTIAHFWWASGFIFLLLILFFFQLIKKFVPRSASAKVFAWPDRALWLLGAICFCCAFCEGAMADWSSLYFKQVINDLNKVSTTGYTAFAFMMAFGRLIGDRLTSRMGYKGILMLDSALICVGLLIAILIQTPVMVIIGFGLIGFGVATIIPIVYSLSGRTKTMATSTALATVSTVGFTGFLVGPPVIGFIAHEVGLRWALLIILFLGLIIFGLGRKVKGD
ncbi:MAG: MFS transporter [Chitinophagaceae bacterium]|nr:MFS transporter [Chitinophagaceae bacterium]